jgi:hypothetical protein
VVLAHRLASETGAVTFVSGRTPPFVEAVRAIKGNVGPLPGYFVVSVASDSVQLLVPRGPAPICFLSLPTARIDEVMAGRISEGTRTTNGIFLKLRDEYKGVTLPLIATGAGLGGVLQLPFGSVQQLQSAIQKQVKER